MKNSTHPSEQAAKLHLEKTAKNIGLKNFFIDCGTIGQNDCLLLIKLDEQNEPIRTIECAEF